MRGLSAAEADPSWVEAWRGARNLLCVRLDNLGDLLMTTPALRALKVARPGRRITLLASRAGAPAARHIPEVDRVLVYDAPWIAHPREDAGADAEIVAALQAGGFDAAVIFTVSSQSALPAALMCRQAGIPLRLAHCRDNPCGLLSHWLAEPEAPRGARHELRRQLDLIAAVGAQALDQRLAFRLDAADRRGAETRLGAAGIGPAAPFVLIHPGASAGSRRHPAEPFAAAAKRLRERLRCPLVFGGSPAEQPLVDSIRGKLGFAAPSLAGTLSLGECAAVIARARLLVANDGDAQQIAAAVGTPVVDTDGLIQPRHPSRQIAQRPPAHEVPCRGCNRNRSRCTQRHQPCLRGVPPGDVAAASELFAARAHRRDTRLEAAA